MDPATVTITALGVASNLGLPVDIFAKDETNQNNQVEAVYEKLDELADSINDLKDDLDQGFESAEMLRALSGLHDSTVLSRNAMEKLSDGRNTHPEAKINAIENASVGIDHVLINAGSVLRTTTSLNVIETVYNVTLTALEASFAVAAQLQSGQDLGQSYERDHGGYRKTSIQLDIKKAIDILNDVETKFKETCTTEFYLVEGRLAARDLPNNFSRDHLYSAGFSESGHRGGEAYVDALNAVIKEAAFRATYGNQHFYDLIDALSDLSDGISVESPDLESGEYRGTDGDDLIYGNTGDDILRGFADSDYLYGGDGNDKMFGGEGSDIYFGDTGNDTINDTGAGQGDIDVARYAGNKGDCDIWSDGTNLFVKTTDGSKDSLRGIEMLAFDDLSLSVQDLAFSYEGGEDGEVLVGFENDDKILGNGGDDVISGNGGDDTLNGGHGNDVLNGGDGNDKLTGGAGNDTLDGGSGYDIAAYDGAIEDYEFSFQGSNLLVKAADGSVDTLSGIEAVSVENQTISVNDLDLTITGGEGRDALVGRRGDDEIFGNGGDDRIRGKEGHDTLDGGNGNDQIEGGVGDDVLKGGAGDDTLEGDDGDDRLEGGEGRDLLKGGAGGDTFVFSEFGGPVDTIKGFTSGQDRIELDADVFTALADGFDADNFVIGRAQDEDDYISYKNGVLYYDADGSGSAHEAEAFAQVANERGVTVDYTVLSAAIVSLAPVSLELSPNEFDYAIPVTLTTLEAVPQVGMPVISLVPAVIVPEPIDAMDLGFVPHLTADDFVIA